MKYYMKKLARKKRILSVSVMKRTPLPKMRLYLNGALQKWEVCRVADVLMIQ